MKDHKSWAIALFTAVCILLNCLGKSIAEAFELPVWLDSVGTVLAACTNGPVCGAIVGACVNIIFSFGSMLHCVYALTSIAIGVIIGLLAQKGFMRNVFRTMTMGFLVAAASSAISVPLNYYFFSGYTGNRWGDGVIDLLDEYGLPHMLSCFVGEFYVDFLDKTLLLVLLYVLFRLLRHLRDKSAAKSAKESKPASDAAKTALGLLIVCCLLGSGAPVLSASAARAEDYSSWVQTIYNNSNGLVAGTATDIAQTNDGVLWVGTYNGLYRYNGTQFKWMDEFESVKTVNCLYTDEEGRLWIGTNDSGLSIYISGNITNVLDASSGMPSDSVRCIAGGNDGSYYVGTTSSMVVVTLTSGISIEDTLPEITYAESIAVNGDGVAAAVTDDGTLYLIDGTAIKDRRQNLTGGKSYSCCAFGKNGLLYVGTSGDKIEVYEVEENGLRLKRTVVCPGLSDIQELDFTDNGELFVCADNGIGSFAADGSYSTVNTSKFNSSIDHMLVDYQGNLWFTSTRLGLLKMCRSVFTEVYDKLGMEEKVVNAITKWNGNLYFGTDGGLDMADAELTESRQSSLTEALDGVRIRSLTVDSKGRLWIATSGKGAWRVAQDGSTEVYTSSRGTLGSKFRTVLERSDGTILLAGDSGITYLDHGRITAKIGAEQGLENPKVLCLFETKNGDILAGTDGNGIAVISGGQVVKHIKKADGLTSEVIMRMVAEHDSGGCFIVTGNGLCYMDADGNVSAIRDFPHYNNFDIVENNGKLFVLSSAGIYVVDKQALLSGGELDYVLLDSKKGLRTSLTPNSWTYIDTDNNLYLPEGAGVTVLNLNNYDTQMRSYRMHLQTVAVDNVSYPVKQGETIEVHSGARLLEIVPEIINFSANDPLVSVYLKGMDSEPRITRQSELTSLVYTNLAAGDYTLYLSVLDNNGEVLSESRYNIRKEYELYEHKWFLAYFFGMFALIIAYIMWLLFRMWVRRTLDIQRRELEVARKQVQMGNEAILAIARTVDAKDERTGQHSFRVSQYAIKIAERIGYKGEELEELRKTALMHDIGKIGIPDSVLNKPGRLNDEEYAIMKSHVVKGAEILKSFTSINHIVDGALYHHERWDGKGYVHGLKGEEIPINARIIGIADAFDAMTTNRVYRKALDMDYVINELKNGRGTQFDPKLLDIMLDLIASGEIDPARTFRESEEAAKRDHEDGKGIAE